ncbi:EF-hand domain-containing protein [Kumtagia ephedrae]|uniref:EF-hand domain-containing protein n=1 Tax=Kumtagia ephedrae TaxID=2116701 RepID=A0A2P7SDF1_9HYPH|nr:EF-hand domain-containing protein [Mesorhizobium ephedrae]PSJ60529.1 hypothetical protein C7I84_11165 [Mesorhizobium ephedrae]
MKKLALTAACVVFLGNGIATAQQAPAMHEGQLNQLDTDKSGGVSKAEYQTFMSAAFSKIDASGDGSISQDEVAKMLTPDQFSSMDANGDKRVSRSEFMGQVMKDFAGADRAGDGQLK